MDTTVFGSVKILKNHKKTSVVTRILLQCTVNPSIDYADLID